MALIKVQTIRQNSGNWKYDIKSNNEYINTDKIIKAVPFENVFHLYLNNEDSKSVTTIDQKSLDDLVEVMK
jgi:hypothetical protein